MTKYARKRFFILMFLSRGETYLYLNSHLYITKKPNFIFKKMVTYDFRLKFMARFNAIYFNFSSNKKCVRQKGKKIFLGEKSEKFPYKSQHGVAIGKQFDVENKM